MNWIVQQILKLNYLDRELKFIPVRRISRVTTAIRLGSSMHIARLKYYCTLLIYARFLSGFFPQHAITAINPKWTFYAVTLEKFLSFIICANRPFWYHSGVWVTAVKSAGSQNNHKVGLREQKADDDFTDILDTWYWADLHSAQASARHGLKMTGSGLAKSLVVHISTR